MIEIDITRYPSEVSRYLEDHIRICEQLQIPMVLSKDSTIDYKGLSCAGYFDDDPLGFAVACGGSYRSWFPTFVHETCHMQQWLDGLPIWTRRIDGTPPSDLFDAWITGRKDLPNDIKDQMIDALVDIELDCERRSAERIKTYDLPIKLDSYIRKSNAYIWSYRYMANSREWNHSSFHYYPQVWRRMPAHFRGDYSILPPEIKAVFDHAVAHLEVHR
jgi:hypothetical protein